MFSQLGPLFKTTFRKTENNDTRLAVPHEERDQRRRKEEENNQDDANVDPWQDNTTVTVPALRTFLVEFLKTLPGGDDVVKATHRQEIEKDTYERPREKSRPQNTQNAKAVRAYQSMASHSSSVKSEGSDAEQNKRVAPTADLLQSKELRDIYGLIEALDSLEGRNVQTLDIKKADSFIEALKEAVQQALKV